MIARIAVAMKPYLLHAQPSDRVPSARVLSEKTWMGPLMARGTNQLTALSRPEPMAQSSPRLFVPSPSADAASAEEPSGKTRKTPAPEGPGLGFAEPSDQICVALAGSEATMASTWALAARAWATLRVPDAPKPVLLVEMLVRVSGGRRLRGKSVEKDIEA